MYKHLGLIILLCLTFPALAKDSKTTALTLRGVVPVKFDVKVIEKGDDVQVLVTSNEVSSQKTLPKIVSIKHHDRYLVSVTHP